MIRAIALVKCREMENWYTIEWVEHKHEHNLESINYGVIACRWSGRLHPKGADVEGNLFEMNELAIAVKFRQLAEFKRCAVNAKDDPVLFWSPRNSGPYIGEVPLEEAKKWAESIVE